MDEWALAWFDSDPHPGYFAIQNSVFHGAIANVETDRLAIKVAHGEVS